MRGTGQVLATISPLPGITAVVKRRKGWEEDESGTPKDVVVVWTGMHERMKNEAGETHREWTAAEERSDRLSQRRRRWIARMPLHARPGIAGGRVVAEVGVTAGRKAKVDARVLIRFPVVVLEDDLTKATILRWEATASPTVGRRKRKAEKWTGGPDDAHGRKGAVGVDIAAIVVVGMESDRIPPAAMRGDTPLEMPTIQGKACRRKSQIPVASSPPLPMARSERHATIEWDEPDTPTGKGKTRTERTPIAGILPSSPPRHYCPPSAIASTPKTVGGIGRNESEHGTWQNPHS